MNYVRAYWEQIKRGEIVTSRRVKAVYKRLVEQMDHPSPDFPYYFDEAAGERPIEFIERFCKQSQGEYNSMLDVLDLAFSEVNHEKLPPGVLKKWVGLITDELSQISKIKRSYKNR